MVNDIGDYMDIIIAIEELYLSGAISLGRRSRSTVYRWTKAINEQLEFEKCNWRVKADYKDCSIYVDNNVKIEED